MTGKNHGVLVRRNQQPASTIQTTKVEKPLLSQEEFAKLCEESPLATVGTGIAFVFDDEGLAQKFVTEEDENAVSEVVNYLGKTVKSKGGTAWRMQGTPDWKTVAGGSLPVVCWEDKVRNVVINGVSTVNREEQLMWDLFCPEGFTFDPNRPDGRLVVNGEVTALRVVNNSQQAEMEQLGWITVSKWNKNSRSTANRTAARTNTAGSVFNAISESLAERDSSAEA